MALSRALLGSRIKEIRCPEVIFSVRTYDSDNRWKCLNESFQRLMTEIYLMFFQSAIALFNQFQQVYAKGRSSHILDAYTDGNFPKQVDC